MKTATDGANYVVLAFDSRDQVDAFLAGTGMNQGGDLFIDGRAMADRLNIKIPEASRKFNISAKVDPKLAALAMKKSAKA